MASYTPTSSFNTNYDADHVYKYRRYSRDGHPVAQDEVERRRAAGLPVVLWRWENHKARPIEWHNI